MENIWIATGEITITYTIGQPVKIKAGFNAFGTPLDARVFDMAGVDITHKLGFERAIQIREFAREMIAAMKEQEVTTEGVMIGTNTTQLQAILHNN